MLDGLLARHEALSAAARAAARALGSPCFAGCHGCCYRLVLVELPDAFLIARHLVATGAATPAMRERLAQDAALAERMSADDLFDAARGCAFLDPGSPDRACLVYEVRPRDCRLWFVHGVPDGSACAPGAPPRAIAQVPLGDLDAADPEADRRSRDAFARAWGLRRPVVLWVPLPLAVLAALDAWQNGAGALTAWRPRLDAASQRVFAHTDPEVQ